MAFTLQAIAGSTSVTLTDGNPFTLRSARGMGGADVRRVTTRGPAQDGDTDLGYRLQPREIELVIGFRATTDAILDGYRDTLMGVFKPLTATPVKLRVTRDDGEIRQIDCYTVSDIKIVLNVAHRPGHYHEATVRLRAADPAWYELAPGTVTVTGTAGLAPNWWLAGGAIGTASVLMSGGTPAQGSAWTYAGTIGTASSFTVALRAARETGNATTKYAFGVDTSAGVTVISGTTDVYFGMDSSNNFVLNGRTIGTAVMSAGTQNYFYTYDGAFDPQNTLERTSTIVSTGIETVNTFNANATIAGTARKWRTDSAGGTAWTGAIPLYALYSPKLTLSQRQALNSYMTGAVGGSVSQAVAIPYEGDLPDYPTISITGPITSPSIVNSVTGNALTFSGISIGAGTTYVIDTRPEYRTVLEGATNKRAELSDDSDLGEWRLEPSPVATGGTNTIVVTGGSAGTATQISLVYYNRFSGF